MSYIELLNNFWRRYREGKLKSADALLYLFLLNECNSLKWKNPFEMQTWKISELLGLTRKTISDARFRLEENGFLKFSEAVGRGPAIYFLEDVSVSDEALFEAVCVAQNKHKSKHKRDLHLLYENTNVFSKDIKDDEDVEKTSTTTSVPPPVFEEVEKLKKDQWWKEQICLKFYIKNPQELDGLLSRFASHSVCEGVNVHQDEKDLKGHFTSWLRKERKNNSNGNTKSDRFSERRGVVPEVEVRKGFKGTL